MALNFDSGYTSFDRNGFVSVSSLEKTIVPWWYSIPKYWMDDNHVLARCLLTDAVIAFAVYDKRTDELVYRKGIIPVEFKVRDSSIDKVVNWLVKQTLTQLKSWTRNVTIV